jgi:hypothetical protein
MICYHKILCHQEMSMPLAKIFHAVRIVIILFLICIATGCMAISRSVVSRPVSDSPNISVSNIGRMKIADAIIFISSDNHVIIEEGTSWFGVPFLDKIPPEEQSFIDGSYYFTKEPGFFIIELSFSVQGQPLFFTPRDLVLHYHGKDLRPVSAYSLVKMYDTTNAWAGHNLTFPLCSGREEKPYRYQMHDRRMYHPSLNVSDRLTLDSNTQHCFAVEYEINPPDPHEEFSVEFSIQLKDQNVPVRIKYVPDTTVEHG